MSARPADSSTARDTLLRALQASAMALRAEPDGSLVATADRVELRSLVLHTGLGTMDVPSVTLTGVEVRLQAANGSFDLLGLAADEVQIEGAELTPSMESGPLESVRLEPLGTAQGRMRVAIRDARWVIDADITMPIVAGRLDFDRVVVEHIGPNSSMGIAPDALYVDAPHRERTVLVSFSRRTIAGVRYEQRGGLIGLRVVDRGSIDLRPFAEAVARTGLANPLWHRPNAEVRAMLDRTKLTGELHLADGVLGTEHDHLVLDGRADGRNGIALDAAVLGQRLVMRWPELSAIGAVFGLLGRGGTAGRIDAALEVHLTGAGSGAPQFVVKVHRMTVRDVALE